MKTFKLEIFDSPATKKAYQNEPNPTRIYNHPLWQRGQFLAYALNDKPPLNANVTTFNPNINDLDVIAHSFYPEFKPDKFITVDRYGNQHEYTGNELKPINGKFNSAALFNEQTNEHIQEITFRSTIAHHSSVTVSLNGVFTVKHLSTPKMQSLIANAINKVLYEQHK